MTSARFQNIPPHPDPGDPDARSPGRFIWWLVIRQRGRVLRGALWGTLWMAGIVLEPYFIRGAIDHGLVAGDAGAQARWTAVVLALGLATAGIGVLRHRTMTFVRLDAAYRTVQVVTRRVAELGAILPKRVAAGEVVTIGTTDIWQIAWIMTMTGSGFGAMAALVLVAVQVLAISPALGVLILVGVPTVSLVVAPLLRRLERSEAEYRRRQGELTAMAGDIVTGLRVLRGIGGERLIASRYVAHSTGLRDEGYRVSAVTSWIHALAVGLPGLFVALVTWLAARMVAQSEITIGQLVAVFAYAGALTVPVSFIIDCAYNLVRGLVSARRVIQILNLRTELADGGQSARIPDGPCDLHDPDSGLTVPAGRLLAIAAADDEPVAALADRLGRYTDSTVTYGGTPLSRLPLTEVRRRILVVPNDAYLFAGTLRDVLRPASGARDRDVARYLHAACADDIVAGLPEGLDSRLGTLARTLSAGQRQRLRLARALLADPEVLIMLEPTSSVDAHTEAAIADRLRAARTGRSTVVTTTSPLLLGRADRVAYLAGGAVVACGDHRGLLADCPGYRALVTRGAEPTVLAGEGSR